MKCEQVEERLVAMVYEDLSDDERGAIETHLAECETCSREAALLHKSQSLLDEAVGEAPVGKELSLEKVPLAAMQRVSKSRRGWKASAALLAVAAAVLVVLQLFSVRIEINQQHFEIAWGSEPAALPSPVPAFQPTAAPGDLLPVIDEHATRLEDLDRLVHFLIRVQGVDSRRRERDYLAMTQQMETLQKQQRRTLGYLFQNSRLKDDLAQQPITPARFEGGLE